MTYTKRMNNMKIVSIIGLLVKIYEHFSEVTVSDTLITGSVLIIICHYFNNNWYQLFLKDVTVIIVSVLIMSFLVIITSLIAFMILIIIEKFLNFIEILRNQTQYQIGIGYRYTSKVIIGLSEYW